MEIFSYADVRMSTSDIQRHINVQNLNEWCASIYSVLDVHDERADIECLWGEFRIHRELIRDGIRFTLPNCKYAVQWTISPNPENSAEVMLHCTVNREKVDADFMESVEEFVEGWRVGVEDWPVRRAAKMKKPCVTCGDNFGGFG